MLAASAGPSASTPTREVLSPLVNGTTIETGMLAEDDSVTFGKVVCHLRAVASAEFPQPVETKSQVPELSLRTSKQGKALAEVAEGREEVGTGSHPL